MEKGDDGDDMMWKKTSGSARVVLREQKEKMLRALEAGMSVGHFVFTTKNMSSMFRIMDNHGRSLDTNFMGMDTFRKWFKGERTKALKVHWVKIIDDLHDKYIGE